MPENELLAAYKSVPIITRSIMTATIILSMGAAVRLIPFYYLGLDYRQIIYKFHVNLPTSRLLCRLS